MCSMKRVRGWNSTLGKKLIMGFTGLLLVGYLIVHLIANLTIFLNDGGRTLNLYAATLESTGPLLLVVRLLLAATFLFHIVTGLRVWFQNMRARSHRYAVTASKGGPSKLTPASRWMIVTGLILMVFIPIHVAMFSFGPYYETTIDGKQVRDLYSLVVERFKEPQVAFSYAIVMFFLLWHLMHGFWSAFQSIGAMNERWTPITYTTGVVLAALLAAGFFVLPLYVYFFV